MSTPERTVELVQFEKYRFTVTFVGSSFPTITVDEAPPTGGDAGPSPVLSLAMAVGHCMSSTLYYSLQRAHVAAAPMRTGVVATVGVNDRGRRRVRKLDVTIHTQPVNAADRAAFDHAVEIFADYCTVSGAVREGIPIDHRVTPG